MSLLIGIDGRELESEPRGPGRVLKNLLEVWSETKTDCHFIIYFKNSDEFAKELPTPRFQTKIVKIPKLFDRIHIWEQFALSHRIFYDKIDVFLSPAYVAPLIATCPTVALIHDISFQSHPEWFSPKHGVAMRLLTKLTAYRAKKIITCSTQGKKEMTHYYGKQVGEKVEVVYWAPEKKFQPDQEKTAKTLVEKKYGIKDPYFLFIGSLFKRRNIPIMLKAFQKFLDQFENHKFVMIGNDSDAPPSISSIIKSHQLENKVLHFDYVNESDLLAFLQATFCFIYPSTYEGYGLPLIEALACGVPGIRSDAETLEEIAGDGAIQVSPLNEVTLSTAMIQLAEQPKLRKEWVEKGLERAKKFSWKSAADSVLEILEKAAQKDK
jgi:glycosyltransferase involved in cell wall biosynthesis